MITFRETHFVPYIISTEGHSTHDSNMINQASCTTDAYGKDAKIGFGNAKILTSENSATTKAMRMPKDVKGNELLKLDFIALSNPKMMVPSPALQSAM